MRIVATALLTSSLFASVDSRLTTLEQQMNEMSAQTVYGNYGAKTASANPKLRTYGAFASVEGLYLKLFEGGLDYGFSTTPPEDLANPIYIGPTETFQFDWRFAFRVSTGYRFNSPDWTLWTEYLRFTTNQTERVPKASNGSLFNNWDNSFNVNSLVSMQMDVSYNTLDLNLGRPYLIRSTASLHPFFGVRGAMIHQHQNLTGAAVSPDSPTTMQQVNNYDGLGLRVGSQVRWHLGAGWSLFGSAAGSLMTGQFKSRVSEYRTADDGSQTLLFKLTTTNRRTLPNTSCDAGVSWQRAFACGRTHLSFSLGYEFDYWWRQNQMLHQEATTAALDYFRWSEDLALQGVKLNCAVDF